MNKREPYKNSVVDKRLVKEKKERKKLSYGQLSKKIPANNVLFLSTINNLAHALSEMETREEIMISQSIMLFSRGKGEKRTSRKGFIK